MVSLFCTTPGKWLCGLRVLHCEKYTRSNSHLPFAVRVEPGGNVPLKWSVLRATIKAAIATCTPILLLLMFTRSGRLKYDELSRSAVVHVTILCKPIFRDTTQNNNNHFFVFKSFWVVFFLTFRISWQLFSWCKSTNWFIDVMVGYQCFYGALSEFRL
jgi:hypothetical protein